MADYRRAFPSRYLRPADLEDRQPVVTIERVTTERIGRDEQPRLVASFVGATKRLPLNVTNCRRLAEITSSDDTDQWAGVRVQLRAERTTFAGQDVACVRIHPPPRTRPLSTREHEEARDA
jgi:hypothetical protein